MLQKLYSLRDQNFKKLISYYEALEFSWDILKMWSLFLVLKWEVSFPSRIAVFSGGHRVLLKTLVLVPYGIALKEKSPGKVFGN